MIWNANLSELIFSKFTNKTFLFGNINSKRRLQLKVETLNLKISRNYLSYNCYLLLSKHFKWLPNDQATVYLTTIDWLLSDYSKFGGRHLLTTQWSGAPTVVQSYDINRTIEYSNILRISHSWCLYCSIAIRMGLGEN